MIKYILTAAMVLSLAACKADNSTRDGLPAPEITTKNEPQALSDIRQASDIDFGAYTRALAKFVKLEIGESMADSESKALTYFSSKASSEGKARFEMDKLQGYLGGQAFIATIDGLADDSVKAEQLYAIGKKQADESYTLVDYGMRIKCWRGENTDDWQTDLCP